VQDLARPKIQRFFLFRGMRQFRQASRLDELPDRVLSALVYGWGNAGYSARHEYIRALVHWAEHCQGPILECGSGLSTLLMGIVAQRCGRRIWSLEHSEAWARRIREALNQHAVTSVEVCLAPLKDYGDFTWYDVQLGQMPRDFGLVVCDGPPQDTRGGRLGMLPVMRQCLRPGCVILLDDVQRQDERKIAETWSRDLGASFEIHGTSKPYASIVVPSGGTG
jgi:predicted O-methyltransferase YrrM